MTASGADDILFTFYALCDGMQWIYSDNTCDDSGFSQFRQLYIDQLIVFFTKAKTQDRPISLSFTCKKLKCEAKYDFVILG